MRPFLAFFGACTFAINGARSAFLICNTFERCADRSITNNEQVECSGYFACHNSSITMTADQRIACEGAFSCYDSPNLLKLTGSTNQIRCMGLFSCANVGLIHDFQGDVQCYGEQSCSQTTIIARDNNAVCSALRSCSSSDITINPQFGIDGTLAAQNAILRANNVSISFDFGASDASNGATIICTHSCQIYCNSGTACNNLTLTCADDFNSSCSYNITCDNALQSDICVDGLTLASPYQLPSLRDIEFSTRDGALYKCQQDSSEHCDNKRDSSCYGETLTSESGICCSASEGCKETVGINATLSISSKSTGDEVAIRADGFHSISFPSGPIQALVGGHMYYTGYQTFDTISIIVGNRMYDVIASGQDALAGNTITNIRDLYCLALEACIDTIVSNVFGDIYAYAELSLTGATVSDVTGNIYCDGTEACKEFVVDAVGGDIISVGYGIMSQAQINNVEGVLIAYGEQALMQAMIANVSEIMVDGSQSLANGQMRQVSNLTVGGSDSMNGAVVISQVQDGDSLIVTLSGDNSASFDIYCNETDFCRINCFAANACTLLNLHCFGSCLVSCNDNLGLACPPESVSGNEWDSVTTFDPTETPSTFPTLRPSSVPTSLPTDLPTITPSVQPTFGPVVSATNINVTVLDVTPAGGDASETDSGADLSEANSLMWGLVVVLVGLGLIALLLFVVGNKCAPSVADSGDYVALLVFVIDVCDFWSDVVYCIAMSSIFADEKAYFYASLVFVLLPFLCSFGLLFYWTQRWHSLDKTVALGIHAYLSKYTGVVAFFTFLGSFASTTSLIQSRLFAVPVLFFPMEKHDANRLKMWRLLNITLTENVPQLVIMLCYLLLVAETNSFSDNLVVYLSLLFTILSIFVSIVYAYIYLSSSIGDAKLSVVQLTDIEIKMILSCKKFKNEHAFCHSSIERAILEILQEVDSLGSVSRRNALSTDVFFINNHLQSTEEIDVYCCITLKRFAQRRYVKNEKNMADVLVENIKEFGAENSLLQLNLLQALSAQMKCADVQMGSCEILSAKPRVPDAGFAFGSRGTKGVPLRSVSVDFSRKTSIQVSGATSSEPQEIDEEEEQELGQHGHVSPGGPARPTEAAGNSTEDAATVVYAGEN